jgi:hypothetical protein
MYKKIFKEADILDDPESLEKALDASLKAGFEALNRIKQHKKVFLKMPLKKQQFFLDALYKLNITRNLPIMD